MKRDQQLTRIQANVFRRYLMVHGCPSLVIGSLSLDVIVDVDVINTSERTGHRVHSKIDGESRWAQHNTTHV